MRRRGFTLIELMIALVISLVVVTLAYGAVQTGMDTGERVQGVRTGIQERAAAREVLIDALRHALPGIAGGPAVFELIDSVGADGLPHDRLRLVTRGVLPPLGTGEGWLVTLGGTADVVMDAVTEQPQEEGRYRGVFRGARGLDIRVRGNAPGAPWREVWDDPGRAPSAVSVSFIGADGQPDRTPLVVRIGLESPLQGAQ
ncbi:MAG: prepilin-type N-terminal cleavage/methylation domain-containing protein [Gemmatimonadaceae bacterium]